jgi:hypothetical protein
MSDEKKKANPDYTKSEHELRDFDYYEEQKLSISTKEKEQ